jgi:Sialic acid synthase
VIQIISEIGSNHGGDLEIAKQMIYESKIAGADIAKFQLYHVDTLGYSGKLYQQVKKAELTLDNLIVLKELCKKLDIGFLCTPFTESDLVDLLEQIHVDWYKVRYADRCNTELLEAVQATGKPIIVSCGWDYTSKKPLVVSDNRFQFTFMYCFPEYPPNPRKFADMLYTFTASPFKGYSNHYPSIIPPLMAVARGAEIIEVHVKLNKTHPIDDAVSIDMIRLTELCRLVRQMEVYL